MERSGASEPINHLAHHEILDDRDKSHLSGEKLPGGVRQTSVLGLDGVHELVQGVWQRLQQTIELPLPDGPGKALKLMIAPRQERIPIYLAAIGPKNTELAGEIADGWIPTLF